MDTSNSICQVTDNMQNCTSSWMRYLWHRMWLKHEASHKDLRTDLIRCLSTWQLTLLGLGNTIGVGIYVLLGVMAKQEAGPSVIISFLIAIFVTWMNAMVFAEFSTYVPQTGAAYIFLYKVFGEFPAFLIGSLIICSGLLSGCVGARAWSGMLDSFFNNTLQEHTVEVLGKIQLGPPFAAELDFVAFVFQVVVTVVVSFNISCTSVINTVLGILTSSVLVFVFFAGIIYGKAENLLNFEHGGFFPYGAVGVVRAASMALYAMSGFEIISMSSEEAKSPARSIPRAVVAELIIVGLVYIGAASGMMLLIPYWLVDLRAPLPSAFEHCGLLWGKLVVTIGPMFGITNLQILGLYGLSRSIYRMSKDGLLFSFFLTVNSSTGVPQRAVLFSGVLTSVFALLFDLSHIVKMSLVLMLTSYISVASALICLNVGETNRTTAFASSHMGRGEQLRLSLLADDDEETLFSRQTGDTSRGLTDNEDRNVPLTGVDSVGNVSELRENFTMVGDDKLFLTGIDEHLESNQLTLHVNSEQGTGEEKSEEFPSRTLQPDNLENGAPSQPAKMSAETEAGEACVMGGVESAQLSPSSRQPVSLVPGVLSTNLLILLHLVTCLTISGQVIFGQADLMTLHPVAVLACGTLVVLLFVFSSLLRLLCLKDAGTQEKDWGFQTPLMPLVPTCSIVLSSMMLFSAAERIGCVEIIVLTTLISIVYVLMTVTTFQTEQSTALKGHDLLEQEMRLISPEGEVEQDDDDTIDREWL